MEPLEHLETLRQASPGTAMHARVRRDESAPWEIAWLIREESARISWLGESPEIEFRFALLLEPISEGEPMTVGLVPVLVRVGPETWEHIYETWIDPLADSALELLVYQERVMVHLCGNQGTLEQQLQIENPLRHFAQRSLARISDRPPWQPRQFQLARERIFERHADIWSLWLSLEDLDLSP